MVPASAAWPFWPRPLVRLRLGVEIDDEDGLVGQGERGGEIDGGGGFGDAAFLVGDGDYLIVFCHLDQYYARLTCTCHVRF